MSKAGILLPLVVSRVERQADDDGQGQGSEEHVVEIACQRGQADIISTNCGSN